MNTAVELAELKSLTRLAEVCEALGIEVDPRNKKKFLCFVHKEKTGSAHIHQERLKCFGCGFSGDVFAVVGARLGLSFKDSLRWIADFYHVPLNEKPLSTPEKQRFVQAKREASVIATDLTAWRRGLLTILREERNAIWEGEQVACRWARAHLCDEHDDPRWELVWRTVMRQSLGDRYNSALNVIERAPVAALLRFWRSSERRVT